MFAFFVRRLGQAILALFCTSILIFLAVYAIGDPAEVLIDPQATDAQVAHLRAVLGLDRPLWQQYLLFLERAMHGSLGLSYFYKVDALDLILQRMPATIELALTASLLALLIGIPLASSPASGTTPCWGAPSWAFPSPVSACPRSGWGCA